MDKIANFEAKVARAPDNLLFRFSLAQALYEAGREAESIPHLEQCAAARADWMLPRILWGKALIGEGRKAEARPVLAEALDLAEAQNHLDPAAELRGILDDL